MEKKIGYDGTCFQPRFFIIIIILKENRKYLNFIFFYVLQIFLQLNIFIF